MTTSSSHSFPLSFTVTQSRNRKIPVASPPMALDPPQNNISSPSSSHCFPPSIFFYQRLTPSLPLHPHPRTSPPTHPTLSLLLLISIIPTAPTNTSSATCPPIISFQGANTSTVRSLAQLRSPIRLITILAIGFPLPSTRMAVLLPFHVRVWFRLGDM